MLADIFDSFSLVPFRLASVVLPGAYCRLVAIVLWHDPKLNFDYMVAHSLPSAPVKLVI